MNDEGLRKDGLESGRLHGAGPLFQTAGPGQRRVRRHHGRRHTGSGGGSPYGGEPFHERRARASSLPAAYANAFAQYVSDVIDVDVDARYFSFAFWTKAPWGRDPGLVARMIQRACQFAACDLCPTLNRSSRNRIPLYLCLAAILLPAQKQHGVPHVHGFLRVPRAVLSAGITVMSVHTNGRPVRVSTPRAVERFATYVRRFPGGAPTSLHVDHETVGREPALIDVTANREQRAHVLGYLTRRGAEVRSWDLTQFVPWRKWAELLAPGVDLVAHRTMWLEGQSQVHEAVRAVESGARESVRATERES